MRDEEREEKAVDDARARERESERTSTDRANEARKMESLETRFFRLAFCQR